MGEHMMGKHVGILTFHRSHNCGSMMQAYALQTVIRDMGHNPEIINFSNEGQQRLYGAAFPSDSLKNLIKNAILLPRRGRLAQNREAYERFIADHFNLSGPVVNDPSLLSDEGFDVVVAGSDQVWNITIDDGDDAYYLPWVLHAKKVAYAPSFGAKNPERFAEDPRKYSNFLKGFDSLSVRERNGRDWIRRLAGIDVPVLLDPTLLIGRERYERLEMPLSNLPDRYLFYYSPSYSSDINSLVEEVSKKYGLPVVAFNARNFYVKGMNVTSSFSLPDVESPATYLSLIKHASVVFTTSFHGTIFSAMYRRPFWTVKNGGMFGDDDRVLTLASTLGIEDRLCPIAFDGRADYLSEPDWESIEDALLGKREESKAWLASALE